MWKYVSRRLRDNAGCAFDRRTSNITPIANLDDNKDVHYPCRWFMQRFTGQTDKDINKQPDLSDVDFSWIDAIPWNKGNHSHKKIISQCEKKGQDYPDLRNTGLCSTVSEKNVSPPSWYRSGGFCSSSSSQNDNGAHSKRWNFDCLNSTWLEAITWSGALIGGWYTSQLINLKLKHRLRAQEISKKQDTICNLLPELKPYASEVVKSKVSLSVAVESILENFTPTVHLVSDERCGVKTPPSVSSSSTSPDKSEDELGGVLNSIENRLGLAAIENGQHKDGINLLRSAATRNHAPALYNLGLCYEMGLGVPVDEKAAMELYRSAAAQEHPGAMYNLGIYYGQGRGGLHRDTQTATRLLRLAAVQGQENAMEALKCLEPVVEDTPRNNFQNWSYPYTPLSKNDNIVPPQTSHFVENVNYLWTKL